MTALKSVYLYQRIALRYRVTADRLATRLSGAWRPTQRPDGSNLEIAFCDVIANLDPEGNRRGTQRYHYLPVEGPATDGAHDATIRYGTYSDRPEDVGGCLCETVSGAHTLNLRASNASAAVEETFVLGDDAGRALDLRIAYTRSDALYSSPTLEQALRVRCPRNLPREILYVNFELQDLVYERGVLDRTSVIDCRVRTPELADLFDGSEVLIGVVSIPWSRRETWA